MHCFLPLYSGSKSNQSIEATSLYDVINSTVSCIFADVQRNLKQFRSPVSFSFWFMLTAQVSINIYACITARKEYIFVSFFVWVFLLFCLLESNFRN